MTTKTNQTLWGIGTTRSFALYIFFKHEQTKSRAAFEQNQQSIELHVQNLNKELSKITEMVQNFEKDRARKFGNLPDDLFRTGVAIRRHRYGRRAERRHCARRSL